MVHVLRLFLLSLIYLISLTLFGCETGGHDSLAQGEAPESGLRPVVRPIVAMDKGKPIYALGVMPVARKVSYKSSAELRQGRFSYPDYREPELARATQAALDETFAGQVHFEARSQFSYEYATGLRMTRRFKQQVRGTVAQVAAGRSFAKLGADDAWRPDYGRIARDANIKLPSDIKKVISKRSGAHREWLAPMVSYIQAIPYGLPPNGFLFPDEVLAFHYGDCDSKAVLAAAIIEDIDPGLDYLFVDLPSTDHLLLGVALKPRPGERSVRVHGQTFVLVEISGPAVLPLGALSRRSAGALSKSSSHAILRDGQAAGL